MTRSVPQLTSMNDYIAGNCGAIIARELGTRKSVLDELIGLSVLNETFEEKDIHLFPSSRHYYWRLDRYSVLAEVPVQLNVNVWDHGAARQESVQFYCSMMFYVLPGEIEKEKPGDEIFHCEFIDVEGDVPKRLLTRMDEYLVPVMDNSEIEAFIRNMWERYYPGYANRNTALDIAKLAEKMGYTIRLEHVHDCPQSSMFFFTESRIPIRRTVIDELGREKELPVEVITIPANTIVINKSAASEARYQLYTAHECLHGELHTMAFRLQRLSGSDMRQIRTREVAEKRKSVGKDKASTALMCMEHQAMRGSYALLLPESKVKPMIQNLYDEQKSLLEQEGVSFNDGEIYEAIGKTVASVMRVRNNNVKARMTQFGFYASKGALNYDILHGRYNDPYGFAPESCPANNYSFTIHPRDLENLIRQDEAFRKMIETGKYLYINEQVVRNDEQFYVLKDDELKLTRKALDRVDLCCLRFKVSYQKNEVLSPMFVSVNCDEAYNRHYSEILRSPELSSDERDEMEEELVTRMPYRTYEAICYLMDGGLTEEDKKNHREPLIQTCLVKKLAEESGISERTIVRMRKKGFGEYKKQDLVMLCLGMHLPPWLSMAFLEKTGNQLGFCNPDVAYRRLLSLNFMDSGEWLQKEIEKIAS